MNQPSYKIVFNGELMPDATLDTVKENLARLFKSDSARINALFTGAMVTLKKNLAEHEADQYLEALQKAGARVRKELDMAANLRLMPTDEHADTPTVEDDALSMSCPKCGHEQPKAESCAACGIIIDKYLARQAQLANTPAATATQPTASPYAPPRADVAENLPEFGELKVFSVSGRIGRIRYLGWSMAMMLCALPLIGIGAGLVTASETLGMVVIALAIVAMISMTTFSVCIGVQRLHDIGWSGWLWLLNFVPIVGGVFSLLMLIIPGTQDANRYGPPPPPNSTSVKVLAWLILLVPIIGILAAIALPQYQSYVERAAQSEYSSDIEAR